MSNVKFYYEWLPLDKNDFRILALLAGYGDFQGNFSDLCAALSLSKSGKNNKSLQNSIERLQQESYIEAETKSEQIKLSIVPKENEIWIEKERFAQIFCKKFITSVSWQNVLKVYLWINKNVTNELIHRAEIADAINVSNSSIISATNVLQDELKFIVKETVITKNADDEYVTQGQYIEEGAF